MSSQKQWEPPQASLQQSASLPQPTPPMQPAAPPPTQPSVGVIAPGKHHMHPAFVILNAVRFALTILVVLFFSVAGYGSYAFFADSSALVGLVLLLLLFVVLVGTTVLFSYIYYKRFLWEITESDIHIYSGIIFKKQVHIPFQRVQSIDFNAPLFERILGIVKLKIETAGGAMNRGVMIPALKLAQAEGLRAEVFARKKQSSAQEEAAMRQKMMMMKSGALGDAAVGDTATGVTTGGAVVGATTGVAGAVVGIAADPSAASVPRFDPLTGQPLAGAVAFTSVAAPTSVVPAASGSWAAGSGADKFVEEVGSSVGGLRGVFAESYQEDAPIEYEHGLSAKELFLSAISGDHNLALVAVFIGLATQVSGIISLLELDSEMQFFAEKMLESGTMLVIAASIVGILLLILLIGVLGTAVSYGGFKARRRGGRIEVERGLIQRQYRGVAISRVQSVEIKQGFIRRLMGYTELKLLTIDSASPQQNQQNNQAMQARGLVVHPFVKKNRIEGILAQMLPEFDARPTDSDLRPLPKVAKRRVIIRHTVFIGLLVGVLAALATVFVVLGGSAVLEPQMILWLLVVIWALFVLMLIGRFIASLLWYKNAAFAYNATMLIIRQGFFALTTTVIPRHKIQFANTRRNPFQRYARVATIEAVTAAGVGGTTTKLRDVQEEDATAYLDWVRPRTKSTNTSS